MQLVPYAQAFFLHKQVHNIWRGNMEGLSIVGSNKPPPVPAGPKMEVGERMSLCGQFIISRQNVWRPVPVDQAHLPRASPYEFGAAEPEQVIKQRKAFGDARA